MMVMLATVSISRMVTQAKEQKILIPLISVLGSLHVHCTDLKPDQTLNALMCTAKRNLLELNFAVGKGNKHQKIKDV